MPATSLALHDDSHLVTRTLGGDPTSFEELFRRYSDRVFSIAMGMVRNEPEAHDIVQETFLNAYRKLHTYRSESPFRGWLFRIASNASLMRLRTRRRRPEQPLRIQAPGFDQDGAFERPVIDLRPLASKTMEDRELGERLHKAIDQLPDKYRAVLILADFEHLSMKEIGERMDLSVPAVKTRLHRARLGVRQELDDYLEGRI